MSNSERPFRWLSEDEQRAWRAYLVASTRLQEELDRQLQRDAGMPHAYYMILAMLSESPDGGVRMTELADVLKISSSRLSHAVSKLEGLGWLRRDADPEDKRVSYACLTGDGKEALVAAAPGHVSTVVDNLFNQLSAEQVEQLYQISARMLEVLAPNEIPGQILRPGR